MDRLFLDANILFSAAYHRGAGLQQLWRRPGVELLTSAYALQEARRNLAGRSRRARLGWLMRTVRLVDESLDFPRPEQITLPEKDWPILLAALAGRATHLLTGDVSHFGRYFGHSIAGVRILLPAEYLAVDQPKS